MSATTSDLGLLHLAASIVAAYVGHNRVGAEQLPVVIQSVYATLSNVDAPAADEAARPEPAVPIKKSVFPDYLVCLEDGRKFKTLKRHLRTSYDMTPDQYRARWQLPASYPMVAQNYAAHRSALAKQIGLGRRPDAPAVPAVPVQHIPEHTRGKAGRPKGEKGKKAAAPGK